MDKTLKDYINSLLEREENEKVRKFVDEISSIVLNTQKQTESVKPREMYYENSYKLPSIYTSTNPPMLETAPKNLKTNTMLSDLKNALQNTADAAFNQPKTTLNLPNNILIQTVSKPKLTNQTTFDFTPIKNSSPVDLNSEITMPEVRLNNSNSKQQLMGFNHQPEQPASVSNTNTLNTPKQKSFENPTTSDSPNWIMPCEGPIVGQYGEKRADHIHNGIDIAVIEGTPIVAIADGTICAIGIAKGYGYWVAVNHGIINGVQVTSEYGHISRWCVSYGQKVRQGQIIAYSGNTGYSQGPHCHLTIRIGKFQGTPVNPWNYINH